MFHRQRMDNQGGRLLIANATTGLPAGSCFYLCSKYCIAYRIARQETHEKKTL